MKFAQIAVVAAVIAGAQSRAAAQDVALPPLPPPQDTQPSPPKDGAPTPVSAASSASPPGAHGDAPAPDNAWSAHPLAFEAQFGLGAPLGYAGIAVDYSPVPEIGLNLGVGVGAAGVQYALSTRLRLPSFSRQSAAYVGVGFSAGPFSAPTTITLLPGADGSGDPTPQNHWDMAYWTNFEVGGETRLPSHVTLRSFAGAGLLLNPGSSSVVGAVEEDQPNGFSSWLFYLGFALGYEVGL